MNDANVWNPSAISSVILVMRIRRALPLVLIGALAACGQATPSPSPSASPSPLMTPSPSPSGLAQQRVCGNVAADMCETVIAAVVRQVPAVAGSPIAVVATLDPNRPSQLGGDYSVLVAFARFGDSDLWFNPPTWVVTQPMMASYWTVEPWREDTLPAHFVALLTQAGVLQ